MSANNHKRPFVATYVDDKEIRLDAQESFAYAHRAVLGDCAGGRLEIRAFATGYAV